MKTNGTINKTIKQRLHNNYTSGFLFYGAQFVQQSRQTVRNPTFVDFGTPHPILNTEPIRYRYDFSSRRTIQTNKLLCPVRIAEL